MEIQLLSPDLVQKIAAGEVIERPASVLKELLENAGDSGASRITVTFSAGGKSRLEVLDNGRGIPKDELELALTRYATSKIRALEDIDDIGTYGFRGEALASMGAVSRLHLSSDISQRDGSEPQAWSAVMEGGTFSEITPSPPLRGTRVQVCDLFFNVPARRKFLKSDSAETQALKRTFRVFATQNPHIELRLVQEQNQVLHYHATSFEERVAHVFDLKLAQCFVMKSNLEGELWGIRGVLSRPEFSIAQSQGLWLFVRGRPVQDRMMMHAVLEGMRNFLMHHQYPQGVIDIHVPAGFADVNVSPAKTQVKFLEPARVFRLIESHVREALNHMLSQREPTSQGLPQPAPAPLAPAQLFEPTVNYKTKTVWQQPRAATARPIDMAATAALYEPLDRPAVWSRLQVVGQVKQTYLICQDEKSLIIIDQHAAHERVLFERLRQSFALNDLQKQPLLVEETVTLDPEILDNWFDETNIQWFARLGFEVERRGPSLLGVKTRPADFPELSIADFFSEAMKLTSISDQSIRQIWATMACHGAIRAGRALAHAEIQELLIQMEEFPQVAFCPHGRPVSWRVPFEELEERFRRVL